jgi:hypothetical protein
MEIEYTPIESDLVALARHQIAVSPVVQQRLRRLHLGYVIGFSLLAVGAYFVLPDRLVSLAFAASASLALFAYPYFSRWRLRRSLPSIVRQKATPASYSARRLRALPDGLEQITEETQSKVGWRTVDAVFETAEYAFLSIDGTYSVVIPRDRLSAGDYSEFMDVLREYRVTAH